MPLSDKEWTEAGCLCGERGRPGYEKRCSPDGLVIEVARLEVPHIYPEGREPGDSGIELTEKEK